MEYYLTKEIHFELGYSNYQFEVTKSDKTQQLLPNTSPNKYKAGITYLKPESFDFQVNLNYTEGFDWLAGTYVGRVPDYAVLNFSAGYYLIKNLEIGVNVYNVLNRKHYEIFGGTYVPRYTTFKLSYQI
jgi:outer membrane receptor protein involved in Fe transport